MNRKGGKPKKSTEKYVPKQHLFGSFSKENVIDFLKQTSTDDVYPGIYKLKMRELERMHGIRRFEYGTENDAKKMVILFLGGTGSGKSTMIDSFVNFLFGVEWEDEFRIKVVDEDKNKNQSQSQTKEVSTYTFYGEVGAKDSYTITFIDTPGYADTSGSDDSVTKSIENLFQRGIDSLNAVGFIVEASRPRLTDLQQYIYNAILSPFGTDIKDNIAILTTFSDTSEPKVLDALKKGAFDFNEYFKFNNAATFVEYENEEADSMNKLTWTMMVKSFNQALDKMIAYPPKSLTLSRDVLQKREQLELKIQMIKDDVDISVEKTAYSEELKREIASIKDKIESNEKFELKINESYWDRDDSSAYCTNCAVCNRTCHDYCEGSGWKYFCKVFNFWGSCKVCGGCKTGKHIKEKRKWVSKTRTIVKTNEDMKREFDKHTSAKSRYESMIAKVTAEIGQNKDTLQKDVLHMVGVINELREIALKPPMKSPVEYIEQLINEAKNEKGKDDRINILTELKKNMVVA